MPKLLQRFGKRMFNSWLEAKALELKKDLYRTPIVHAIYRSFLQGRLLMLAEIQAEFGLEK